MGLTQKLGTIPLAIQTDSSNNVGIGGAANASYKLAVTGASLFTGALTATGQVEGTIINSTSNAFRLNGNNALSLVTLGGQSVVKINAAGFWGTQLVGANDSGIVINNTGQVGIGTTAPDRLLQISNTAGQAVFSVIAADNDSADIFFGDTANKAEAVIRFVNGSNDLRFLNGGTERMRITTTGLVGVNTSSPQRTFDARGTVNLSTTAPTVGSTSGAYADVHLRTFSGYPTAQAKIVVVDFWTDFYSTYTDGFRWFNWDSAGTTPVERMRITGGGDVGIGGSISGQKLYVKAATANGSTNAFLIHDSNGSDLLFVRSDGLITTGGAVSPYNFNPGGRVMYVNSSGQVGSNPSTRESKININPISDVSYIYDLNPVSFYFRKTNMETYEYTDEYYDEIRYGFIADEVEPLNTDLVSYNVNEDGTKKMAGVEYISMIPVLVKALQEQKKIIDELSAKVTALENK